MSVRNEEEHLGGQLMALADQEWEAGWELVIVDNESTDGTLGVIEAHRHLFDDLRVMHVPGHASLGAARNRGFETARGDVLISCDADDRVERGWLKAIVRAFDDGATLACGPLRTQLLNSEFWRSGRDAIQSEGPQQSPGHPPHAAGANLAFTRSLFEEVGGFDEELTNLTDVEFCWKAARLGAELVWVPGAVVHYRLRQSVRSVFNQARSYAKSRAELERRHGPDDAWMVARPWYREIGSLVLLVVEATRLVIRGRGARAVWLAGRWVGRIEGRLDAKSR